MRQAEDRSIGGLFRDLMQDLASLVRNETELAKAEMSEKVSQAGSGLASLAIAGVVLLAGLIILLLAAVYGLSLIWPQWLAALVVGGAVTLIGLILLLVARSKLRPEKLTPQRTTESIRKDTSIAQERMR
jgi:xanthine/uracil permease